MNDELRKIQMIEYKMLKELFRVCEKHGLKIFLAQGTLLGAVRHKGFIPWDDDLDVIMPWEDADRLMKIFPEEVRGKYFLTDYTVERHYPLIWRKIRVSGTLSRPKQYKDLPINWGICMDVFSIYPLCANKFVRCFEVFLYMVARKMLLAEMTKYENGHNLFERFLEKIPIGIRHFVVRCAGRCMKHNPPDSKYIYIACKRGHVMERSVVFGPENRLRFEDGEYTVPSDYRRYLELVYGPDYMTPPPEEERKGHALSMGNIEWSYGTEDGDKL